MIRVHVFDWVKCRWEWVYRPASVVRSMRHLSLGLVLTCGPSVPPTFGVPPTPPSSSIPPVSVESPPPLTPDIAFPPPWGYSGGGSGGGGYTYVGPAPGGLEGLPGPLHGMIPVAESVTKAPTYEICDVTPVALNTPSPLAPVDAPGPLAWFLGAVVLLFIWRAVPEDGSVIVEDR